MQQNLENRTFLLFLIIVSIGFLIVLKPFFGTIFWACAITIIFYPLHLKLEQRLKGRTNLSALITLFACILIVVIPVTLVVSSVVSEGADFYKKLEEGQVNPAQYVDQVRSGFPAVQQTFDRFGIDTDKIKEGALSASMTGGKWLAQNAISIGQNTFKLLLNICLMLYLIFFLLRDGKYLLDLLIRALPMGDARERLLANKFGQITRATIKGNLVIAIIQGTLGGLIFWALGIPGALLWGVVMAAMSLIPAVGPAIVWAPVALYLFATGANIKAIILIGFGMGVIGLVDNILRPILVGRDTRMPDYIVLLSTLGGLAIFGLNGFVIGPLVAGLFIAFWGIFIREMHLFSPEQKTLGTPQKPEDSAK
jgi:predicted PurR-regulated permease PerM